MRPKADPQGHARRALTPAAAPPENLLPPSVPPVPASLGATGAAVWAELWQANAAAYNQVTDRHVVERYCSLLDRREELLAVIAREGWIDVGSKGQVIQNPAARILADCEAKLVPLEDRLGLNPEARLRLGTAAVEHRSKLDAFLEDDS